MRRVVVAAASVLALSLGLAACATKSPEAQLALAARPKQTYDPAFQNGLDALNNPAISFSPPLDPRRPQGR